MDLFTNVGVHDKILLLGEGNFSFSCCLLKLLKEKCGINEFSNIFATCFQNEISPIALNNVNFLKSEGAEVLLGIDATKLEDETKLKSIKFNKIIFNFPHVGGKMKIHLNRALLCNFFVSCSNILAVDGEVLVTLCAGQGGTPFEGINRRWDDTWQIVEQAAHGSFILSCVEYFPSMAFEGYHPVGYRGREQKFSINSSVLHVFKKVTLPVTYIDSDYINNISNYHVLENDSDIAVSYAHKLAINKNPLENHRSIQYFLTKKLYEFVSNHSSNIVSISNLPYHTEYNLMKAPCMYKESLHSLRSSLLDVTSTLMGSFITEGLVFLKFGPDFSHLSVYCQAVIGGSNNFFVIKDFINFIEKIFEFDGSFSLKESDNEWFILAESDRMLCRKVAYCDVSLNSIVIDIDHICSFVFKTSLKEIWADKTIFDHCSFRLFLPSLYPVDFYFDVSFTSKKDLDEDEFFKVLHHAPDNLIDSVELLSVYQPTNVLEKSYCYRLKYKSINKPLYRKLAIDIHRLICNLLKRWNGIIINNYSTETAKLPLRTIKKKTDLIKVRPVIDVRSIRAVGGKGGDGCISLLRLWKNDHAGPDGGDGGNGGHVLIEASTSINSLNHLNSVMKGQDGEKGFNKDCNGKNAQHTIAKVPVGTVVKRDSVVVGDLSEEGSMFILARGGAGGRGNKFFASDIKQVPLVAEYGANGEDICYTLELKSVAKFGLVGLPNAGKSTLLQAISRAKPKVASYPFTTLKPHLGMVHYRDYEQISVADLPGLIEGSHLGKGLGIQFLRHTERCSCLIIVLDVTKDPYETFLILKKELSAFDKNLMKKKMLIILNKIDLPYSEESTENLMKEVGADSIIKLSAKYGLNISEFLNKLRTIYEENFANA